MHYPFGLPVVDSADAVGLGVRGVVVSVEMIVPEDTGAAVTISESAQVQIYVMQMRHSAD